MLAAGVAGAGHQLGSLGGSGLIARAPSWRLGTGFHLVQRRLHPSRLERGFDEPDDGAGTGLLVHLHAGCGERVARCVERVAGERPARLAWIGRSGGPVGPGGSGNAAGSVGSSGSTPLVGSGGSGSSGGSSGSSDASATPSPSAGSSSSDGSGAPTGSGGSTGSDSSTGSGTSTGSSGSTGSGTSNGNASSSGSGTSTGPGTSGDSSQSDGEAILIGSGNSTPGGAGTSGGADTTGGTDSGGGWATSNSGGGSATSNSGGGSATSNSDAPSMPAGSAPLVTSRHFRRLVGQASGQAVDSVPRRRRCCRRQIPGTTSEHGTVTFKAVSGGAALASFKSTLGYNGKCGQGGGARLQRKRLADRDRRWWEVRQKDDPEVLQHAPSRQGDRQPGRSCSS